MSWDTSPARSVSFTVTVAGVVRPHESLDWGQDITSDMPGAVTAGGQVAVRTGTIVWAREALVETSIPSPWRQGAYWIPATGDPVTIDAHDGTNTVRVFTGTIDTIEGDAHGNRTSKVVAEVERHNKVVRYGSLTRYGSPVDAPTGNGLIRQQATTPVWLVHEITRDLGYHAVPPRPADSKIILDAPLQGSTYNYFQNTPNGEMVVSHRPGYESLAPVWAWGQDGFGISNARLDWVPRTGAGTGAGAVGVSCVVFSPHAEDALFTVWHGNDITYLRVLADGRVRASTEVGGSLVMHTATETVPAGDGPHRVSAVYRAGQISVRVNGVSQTFTAATPSGAVTKIRLDAGPSSCVAGVQVWHPSTLTDHNATGWEPTARFRYGTGTHSTILTPSVRDRRARDVLDDYANALLSPVWIDGAGVLQIVTGKALHDQAPSLTVDALAEVSDLSYTMESLDHRPTVELSYKHAYHSNPGATTARTTVWQGNGGEVTPDAADEMFVEVPDDEEWIMPSDPAQPSRLTFDSRDAFNTGTGTWWGLSEDITAPDYLTPAEGGSLLVETLTPWVWKYTTTYPGENGAMQKAPTSTYIKTRYREMDLPIVRARSHVRYEPRTVSATVGSDPYLGVLSHDAGKWITTTAAASDMCQWVHSMVSTPTPVLSGIVLRFNPEVDVGRKVTVKAQPVFGVDFEALVLSVDHNPYDDTTTITARVTRVTGYAASLHEVDHAHIGMSLDQWEQAREGRTLTSVAGDPYTTT